MAVRTRRAACTGSTVRTLIFLLRPLGQGKDTGFCPVLLGEVVSDPEKRWRMLLQLAVCVRLNSLITKSPFVAQAIYLSESFCAERYLAYADTKELDANDVPLVYIARDIFDVRTLEGTIKFLRSMYNFENILSPDGGWDSADGTLCPDLYNALKALPGVTSRGGTSQGGTSQGGTSQSGTSQGGTSQSGTSQGGTSRSGTSQGGASRGESSQSRSSRGTYDLSTLNTGLR